MFSTAKRKPLEGDAFLEVVLLHEALRLLLAAPAASTPRTPTVVSCVRSKKLLPETNEVPELLLPSPSLGLQRGSSAAGGRRPLQRHEIPQEPSRGPRSRKT